MAKSNKPTQAITKKTQSSPAPQAPSRKKRVAIVAIVLVVVLFVFNLLTGYISYGAMTVWCGRSPITASRFGYHYFRSGEVYYGPGPLTNYYCTEQEARDAGFNPGYR